MVLVAVVDLMPDGELEAGDSGDIDGCLEVAVVVVTAAAVGFALK